MGVLFASLAVVVACETVFGTVVPTLLGGRLQADSTVVGIVVGVALGLGLAAVPIAVPSVRRGRATPVLLSSGLVLVVAGPLCVLAPSLPVTVTIAAAFAFGGARAIAMLVLLTDVGRLGPASPGHGYNGAAQRVGSAVGGVAAAWILASGWDVAGMAVLAVGGGIVLVLAGMRPSAPSGVEVDGARVLRQIASLVRWDSWIRASLLVNVVVWLCVFVGNTLVPVGLVQSGRSARDAGAAVLIVLLVRDVTAGVVGVLGWRFARRLAPARLMLVIGGGAAVGTAVIVGSGFSTVGLLVSAVLLGCCVAFGIACANVVATSGPARQLETRLAASQSVAGAPIALLAVVLVSSLGTLGPGGALTGAAVLALVIAAVAASSLRRAAIVPV